MAIGTRSHPASWQEIECRNDFGHRLRGKFRAGRTGVGAVLLLHQYLGTHRHMQRRAALLSQHGFGVLLMDLQGHGNSGGWRTTFGHREASDARAAVAALRGLAPNESLGAIGRSLGGAALMLADLGDALQAVVLESVFPTLEAAIRNRATEFLGTSAGARVTAGAVRLLNLSGVPVARVTPQSHAGALRVPALFLTGEHDPRTTVGETHTMCLASPAGSRVWIVPGAAHEDLHAVDPAGYEARVVPYLVDAMARHPGAGPSSCGEANTSVR